MEVQLINKDEIKELFKNFGSVAAVCYNSSTAHAEAIGKSCLKSGHMSGSRGDYFKFKITDIPRFTMDQAVRATTGVMCNCQSFRYVNKENLGYSIPKEILEDEELVNKYTSFMDSVSSLYTEIQSKLIENGKTPERANEQARYVLPMSTHTSFVIGFDLEALIHFMNVRLCSRAEDTIREMAIKMKKEVINVLPELEEYLVPSCEKNLWCPEHKGCGRFPSKTVVKEIISNYANSDRK